MRRGDASHAVIERGIPLVGLAAEEAVELVEARTRRPAVGRAGGADLPRRRLVVLAEEGGAVTVQAQHLRERRDAVGALPRVARKPRGGFGDAAHVVHVVVAAGEQGRPRGRAERRGVELVVAQSLVGEAVGGRHAHRSAEGARHAEAHVVHEHDEHIRRARGRLDLEARRSLGIAGVEHRAVRVVRFRDGQHRPVEFHFTGLRPSLRRDGRRAQHETESDECGFGFHR